MRANKNKATIERQLPSTSNGRAGEDRISMECIRRETELRIKYMVILKVNQTTNSSVVSFCGVYMP